MNGKRNLTSIHGSDRELAIHPKAFVFFDKKTGVLRFEVKANADGSMPVDHVTSLLAAQCVMRGQTPKDFGVVVAATENLLGGVGTRADKLIRDCQMFRAQVPPTKREREILHEVLQNRTNKEIAAKVNLSVRTVKFHISALLAKFGVANRMGLMQKTVDLLSEGQKSTGQAIPVLVADRRSRVSVSATGACC
jgi:DNA-binding CsgD family transcriptional regulator